MQAQHSSRSSDHVAKPILKWVGGKTRLLSQLLPLLPTSIRERPYIEPFAGGAALFFALQPASALLSDVNPALCGTYVAVRDEVESVVQELKRLAAQHSRENYYRWRRVYNNSGSALSNAHRAALFLYLNRTCFNGLHRLNRAGAFNVPAGDLDAGWSVDEQTLRLASERLAAATLMPCSFEVALDSAVGNAFVYLDPPYDPRATRPSFTRYNGVEFGPREQAALSELVRELDARGVEFMLSNSDTEANRERYARFDVRRVVAPRQISAKATSRGSVHELVIRNYA